MKSYNEFKSLPRNKQLTTKVIRARYRQHVAAYQSTPQLGKQTIPKQRNSGKIRVPKPRIRGEVEPVNKPPKKKSGFLTGLLKALKVGSEIAEFVLPFFGDQTGIGVPPVIQHSSRVGKVSSMVGVAEPLNIPGASLPIINRKGENFTVTHRGLLSPVDVPAATAAGDNLFRTGIDPSRIEEWLSQICKFEKYRFKDIYICYMPQCSSATEGAVAGFFEWDVDDPLSLAQGEDTVRDAMAHTSADMTNVWRQTIWHFDNREEPYEWYYVDRGGMEPRLTTQALFTLIAATDMADAKSIGQLEVCYTCELAIPETRSLISGYFSNYIGSNADCELNAPFGDAIAQLPLIYQQGTAVEYTLPQNTALKYYYRPGPPIEAYFQLPQGFWHVSIDITGTGIVVPALPAHVVWVYGEYIILQEGFLGYPGLVHEGAIAATGITAYACIYSSGITNGPLNAAPPNFFGVELSAWTTITMALITVSSLNGTLPGVSPATALERMSQRLSSLEKGLDPPKFSPPMDVRGPTLAARAANEQNRVYRNLPESHLEEMFDEEGNLIIKPKTYASACKGVGTPKEKEQTKSTEAMGFKYVGKGFYQLNSK